MRLEEAIATREVERPQSVERAIVPLGRKVLPFALVLFGIILTACWISVLAYGLLEAVWLAV
jgi:hypothetical protein